MRGELERVVRRRFIAAVIHGGLERELAGALRGGFEGSLFHGGAGPLPLAGFAGASRDGFDGSLLHGGARPLPLAGFVGHRGAALVARCSGYNGGATREAQRDRQTANHVL